MRIPDPSESVSYTLWKLTHAMQQRMTVELAALGLNLPQVATLVHIARGDAISTADLARVVLMTPQNMSLTAKKLEADGYLTKRTHETHGRINRLELTPLGQRVLGEALAALRTVEDVMFGGLQRADRATLLTQLQQALTNLKSDERSQ
jgi:DNA-binding MarR family transcriptional regulator